MMCFVERSIFNTHRRRRCHHQVEQAQAFVQHNSAHWPSLSSPVFRSFNTVHCHPFIRRNISSSSLFLPLPSFFSPLLVLSQLVILFVSPTLHSNNTHTHTHKSTFNHLFEVSTPFNIKHTHTSSSQHIHPFSTLSFSSPSPPRCPHPNTGPMK